MEIDPRQEVRRLLDLMTQEAMRGPSQARPEAIRDWTYQLTTQTRTPALPYPEPHRQVFDDRGHLLVW